MNVLDRADLLSGPQVPASVGPHRGAAVARIAMVTFQVLLAASLVPPNHDDGWILERGRLLVENGFSQSIDPFVRGSVTALGRVNEFLVGVLAQFGSVLAVRSITMAAVILTWALIEVLLERWRVTESNRWVGALIFMISIPALASSLRPESITGLFLIVILLLEPYRETHLRSLGLLLWIPAAAALSIHQTGWAVVAAALTVGARSLWHSPQRSLAAALGFGAAGLVSATAIVLSTAPLPLFIFSSRSHVSYLVAAGAASEQRSFVGVLEEPERYSTLLAPFTFYAGRLPHLIIAAATMLGILAYALTCSRRSNVSSPVGVMAASILGLSFTNSKWIVHLLALAPIAAVTIVLLLERLEWGGIAGDRLRSSATSLLGLILLYSAGQQGSSGLQIPLAVLPWEPVAPRLLVFTAVVAGGILLFVGLAALALSMAIVPRTVVASLGVAVVVVATARASVLSGALASGGIVTSSPLLEGLLLPLTAAIMIVSARHDEMSRTSHRSRLHPGRLGAVALVMLAVVVILADALGEDPLEVLVLIERSMRPGITLLFAGCVLLALLRAQPRPPDRRLSRLAAFILPAGIAAVVVIQTTAIAWGPVSALNSERAAESFGASHLTSIAQDGRSCDLFERFMRGGRAELRGAPGPELSAVPAVAGLMPCRPLAPPIAGLWPSRSHLVVQGGDLTYFREIRVDVIDVTCRALPPHRPDWTDAAYVPEVCVVRTQEPTVEFSETGDRNPNSMSLEDVR